MLKDAYRGIRLRLEQAGIEGADFESRALIEYVTGYDRAAQIAHGGDTLAERKKEQLEALVEKRLARYPLQYLLGEWSFMGIPLSVGEGVLIPRDDTEVCAGLCLDWLKGRKSAKAIDLCAGSGAISLALERFGKAEVTAVELSGDAFKFLTKNIKDNKSAVKAVKGDIFSCYQDFENGEFDLIVSNPPYIKRDELKGLQPEVRFEPAIALDGGESGLVFYKAIVKNWSRKLKSGGALVFELGEGQAETVSALMKAQGFENIRTELDFGGCHRAIIGTML